MLRVDIRVGDCRELLRRMPDQSVHCCITSPPYFGLRDYGAEGQLGQEASPDEFVDVMVSVFREVRRVLRDDGTLWLNIGDSYARNAAKGGSGPGGKNKGEWGYGKAQSAKTGSSDGAVGRAARPGSRASGLGIKEKDLIGIPWMLAFALRADGWYLRQEIIWHKPNPMPESVKDRCTRAHEQIFMLSKSPVYYHEQMVEPAVRSDQGAWSDRSEKQRGHGRRHEGFNGRYAAKIAAGGAPKVRNKRDVWTVATRPFTGAHFATFPLQLVLPCVEAACPPGGIVLDPFFGAGTTALAARELGRHAIGLELNPDYALIARKRLGIETVSDKLTELSRAFD